MSAAGPFLMLLLAAANSAAPAQPRESTIVEQGSPAIAGGVLTEAVGLETAGDMFTPLLEAGCKLPCESTQVFSTVADNQGEITVQLLRAKGGDAIRLGEFRVEGIPRMPRGRPQVAIRIAAEGRNLTIEASDVATHAKYRVVRSK